MTMTPHQKGAEHLEEGGSHDAGPAVPRTWGLIHDGTSSIGCYPNPAHDCIIVGAKEAFTVARMETEAFDEPLSEATKSINSILRGVVGEHERDGKMSHLAIIVTPGGPMLAWVKHVSGREESMQALGL